jgi:hypothetical protein
VSPSNQYFVFNPNKDNPVFVAYGETANITATIPGANSAAVVAIPPYGQKVFTGPQCSSSKTCMCVLFHHTTMQSCMSLQVRGCKLTRSPLP